MCGECVRNGEISQYLYDIILGYCDLWPDAHASNGHIVLADYNVEDGHIAYCLSCPDQDWHEPYDSGPWRMLLHWMFTIPEDERCPKLRDAGVEVR